jgi:hypothetical protein
VALFYVYCFLHCDASFHFVSTLSPDCAPKLQAEIELWAGKRSAWGGMGRGRRSPPAAVPPPARSNLGLGAGSRRGRRPSELRASEEGRMGRGRWGRGRGRRVQGGPYQSHRRRVPPAPGRGRLFLASSRAPERGERSRYPGGADTSGLGTAFLHFPGLNGQFQFLSINFYIQTKKVHSEHEHRCSWFSKKKLKLNTHTIIDIPKI